MNRNNILLIAFAVLLLSSCATSKKIKMADDLFEEGSFYNAVDKYEEAFEKKENNTRLTFQIAETNRNLKDYAEAEKWYAKTVEMNEAAWPEAKFYQAQMLKAQGKYDESIDAYNSFLDMGESSAKNKGDDSAKMMASLKKRAKIEIEGSEMASDWLDVKPEAEVEHVEGGLNNSLQDFSPKYAGEGQVLMAALLPEEAIQLEAAHENNEDYYSKMYYATEKNGTWTREILGDDINSSKMHVGNGVVSADGKTMYFTKCEEDDAHRMLCDIYKAEMVNGEWSNSEPVNELNKKNSSNTQPAIGVDANGNEMLYFASNRSGGKGGYDIWYSDFEDGEFNAPKNLTAVNTKWDDMTPYYDAANSQLYFSSEGYAGLGGLDVFKVAGNVDSWEEAITNLGSPINSSADDLYLALNGAGTKGYMVSNRSGTTSSRGETCCDDVWSVNLVQDIYIAFNAEDSAGNVIEGVDLALYSAVDGDFNFIGDGVSSNDGDVVFLTEDGLAYKINGSKDGYWPSIENVTADAFGSLEGDTLFAKVIMRPVEKVVVQNVYFAFDKHGIRESYKSRMDSIFTLMTDYDELIVKIDGHTDSKGSNEYNQKLSEERAEEAKAYFLELGVDEDRILTKGYSEDNPIAPNENEDGSDNPAGRAKNRRVEFKLLNDVNEDLPIEIEYGTKDPFTID